jgi:hypothetical protein
LKDSTEILEKTFSQLEALYRDEKLKSGVLLKVAIIPGWNIVIGSQGQAGMAMNFTGWEAVVGYSRGVRMSSKNETIPERGKGFIRRYGSYHCVFS